MAWLKRTIEIYSIKVINCIDGTWLFYDSDVLRDWLYKNDLRGVRLIAQGYFKFEYEEDYIIMGLESSNLEKIRELFNLK